jgi:hypothetical protein
MPKVYPTAIQEEYNRKNFIVVNLVSLYLPTGTLNFCTGGFDLEHDGVTYSAQGEFIGFSNVNEDFDVKVGKFTIYLSALTSGILDYFVDQDIEGRRVIVSKAFLQIEPFTLDIILAPVLVFDGQISNISIVEGPSTASINVDCVTLFADFERRAGRKTNNGSNHAYQNNQYDQAFKQSGYIGNTEFLWGRKQ